MNPENKPDIIEKRVFTCLSCGYTAQVYGEQYFDYGTRNFIITFTCLECKILFEGIVTKREYQRPPIVEHDLADEIICLNCGSNRNRVWSKETEACPKCNEEMNYTVEGTIKVHYNPDPKRE